MFKIIYELVVYDHKIKLSKQCRFEILISISIFK